MGYRNFGNEDSQIQHFQHYGNKKYLGKEKDVYKKVVYRKKYHNEDFTDKNQSVPGEFLIVLHLK